MVYKQWTMVPLLSLACAAACADDGGGGRASASASASSPSGLSVGGVLTVTTAAATEGAGGSSGGESEGGTLASGGGEGGGGLTGGAQGDTEPKFDLGEVPDQGGSGPAGDSPCVKVDLLFVVDDSSSMQEEQVNLIASVPTFVQEIQQELAHAESLHVGVVTTDAYAHNQAPCAGVLGGLVTQTGGVDSSAALCGPYVSGLRFMTEQDDLAQRFACAAQVGTDGDGNEMPIDAALAALGPGLAAPGACNEGFVRGDALLVLVLITDEEEEGSAGAPPQWFDQLVALKGGLETNVVVLSLIGPANPMCMDAAEVGYRLIDFTSRFTYGIVGQICAGNYQPFFHDAIAGIAEACHHFMPSG